MPTAAAKSAPTDTRQLIARKAFRYEGRDYLPGEVLEPQPSGLLRTQLVDHRFAVTEGEAVLVVRDEGVAVRNIEKWEAESTLARDRTPTDHRSPGPDGVSGMVVRPKAGR